MDTIEHCKQGNRRGMVGTSFCVGGSVRAWDEM